MKPTILIVSDVEYSALSIAARSRAKIQRAEIIYAINYKTPTLLLRELIAKRPEIILFSWRQALIDVLNVSTAEKVRALRSHSKLAVLIPDHLGISTNLQLAEIALLNYVDYYLVTSEVLYDIYSNAPGVPRPLGVLHDIPDVDLIRKVRTEAREKELSKAIWVGNSTWGINQGFNDHKGFYSVIKPLSALFEGHNECTKFEIIDSAKGRKSNIDVLRTISTSSVLLQSSVSEGTGLPILEALGLGVTPVTTDVGIAREVLRMNKGLIIPRDPTVFHSLVHQERLAPTLSKEDAIEIFETYISSISSEEIPSDVQEVIIAMKWSQPRLLVEIRVFSRWVLRFYLNLAKRKKILLR